MTSPLRIAILRAGGAPFNELHDRCVQAGHEPVVFVCPRLKNPDAAAAASAADAVATAPPGVPLLLTSSMRSLEAGLLGFEPDLILSVGFPRKLPPAVLRIPRRGSINLHPSLLPRHRGAAPVHWAIREGDAEIGWTIHWMDEHFDTGNIISQVSMPMPEDVSPAPLWEQMDRLVFEELGRALDAAAAGYAGVPQVEADATYADYMDESFYVVDWSWSAARIHNQVRTFRFGLPHSPGPYTKLDGRWVNVLETRLTPGEGIAMTCGTGTLWITDYEVARPRDQYAAVPQTSSRKEAAAPEPGFGSVAW